MMTTSCCLENHKLRWHPVVSQKIFVVTCTLPKLQHLQQRKIGWQCGQRLQLLHYNLESNASTEQTVASGDAKDVGKILTSVHENSGALEHPVLQTLKCSYRSVGQSGCCFSGNRIRQGSAVQCRCCRKFRPKSRPLNRKRGNSNTRSNLQTRVHATATLYHNSHGVPAEKAA